ncbi:ParB/RepB/Spo0J family partition protein [Microbacterium sp.]|uniref:ParB/RepB/Spo0J family partition protein n=1 Tax=Microbacterium sp. TaxID=51671 RepID=UPI003F6E7CFC
MAITYDPTTADTGTIQKIPAGDLIIDPNVRTKINLDKSFVSSIRVYGFEQYPVGYQEDGKTHITIGQRRVSAALEIGWPLVPVVIKPKVDAEGDRAEELRILTQLAENEQRTALGDDESSAAYKQLALIGVSEDQIARKTNSPKARITTALKVADSQTAIAAIEKHQLTLDQAAILVEFEDNKTAVDELQAIAAERPDQLEHVAQRLRSAEARRRHGQSIADKAKAEGFEVLFRDPNTYQYGPPNGYARVDELWRADDEKRTRLTVDDLATIEGRAVWIDTTSHGDEARATWCVKDHKKHGLASYYDNSGAAKGPLTDEEKAARRQKRTDKAEMIDATVVRRTWIRDTLLAPTARRFPDDAIAWITATLWHAPGNLSDQYGNGVRFTAEHLLSHPLDSTTHTKNPETGEYFRTMQEGEVHAFLSDRTDHMRLALAVAIGRTEEVAGNPKAVGFGQDLRLAPYLRQLQAWGYTLADVEQRIVTAADKNRKNAAK